MIHYNYYVFFRALLTINIYQLWPQSELNGYADSRTYHITLEGNAGEPSETCVDCSRRQSILILVIR